ncbi:SoxR reducing system RseC family protein [Cobetia sp. MMG027]|uniref:SoxR reducing system RseC family protein n=1 Tax=unclassified Cobetia TaxID=2609414 RepID=UPI0022FEC3AA|nr:MULTISPECIES: SoxR reducing system RseC family protein [unclassified Cobetia]MDA5563830.1 SoxR reducing system RseC family protein [Cobetia sp. MMG027]MDH2290477.1 SoxR reducing system RseC family protein [Cobetia sp. 10Alg 146]
MMQEEGQVTGHGREGVWVETQRRSTCGACKARSSCGSGLLSQFSRRKAHRVLIHVPLGEAWPMVGERVVIGIDESAFLRSAGLLYGLPLMSGMLGGIVAEQLAGAGALVVPLGFALSLAAGLGVVRWHAARPEQQALYRPRLLRRLGVGSLAIKAV